MKENINFLGEEFENEISECKKEEDSVRDLEAQYKKSLIVLKDNNKKRVEAINQIRLSKIQEIDEEVKQSSREFKKLYTEGQEILNEYCKKNGHKDILIDSEHLGFTGKHSFTYGRSAIRQNRYKCTVCGRQTDFTEETYCVSEIKKYEQIIPNEVYDDVSLNKNGKSLKEIMEELQKIDEYINYLGTLKRNLCVLFGHDAEKVTGFLEDFKCTCCGRMLSNQEYINSYHEAKYRGVVPFYYHISQKQEYIISPSGDLTSSLPTYQDYQKTRKRNNH